MSIADDNRYQKPPETETRGGELRRVGFELEFSGIGLEQAVAAVGDALGGKIGAQTAAETVIDVDGLGEFIVELDWDYLKRKAAEEDKTYSDDEWLEFMSQAAALLVPIEVVCPPSRWIGSTRSTRWSKRCAGPARSAPTRGFSVRL